jgi:hypothetical protein
LATINDVPDISPELMQAIYTALGQPKEYFQGIFDTRRHLHGDIERDQSMRGLPITEVEIRSIVPETAHD